MSPSKNSARQQRGQGEPIEGSDAADAAVRYHPHISVAFVDIGFESHERVVEMLDQLLSGSIKSALSCAPQLHAFTHKGHVSVPYVKSARAQHQGMGRRVDDG